MKRITFQTEYTEPVHPIQAAVGDTPATTRADLLCWSPTPDGTALAWFDAAQATIKSPNDSIILLLERFLVWGITLHIYHAGTCTRQWIHAI